jgi:hypothetical protein
MSRFLQYEAQYEERKELNSATAEEELEFEAERKALNRRLIKKKIENTLSEQEYVK